MTATLQSSIALEPLTRAGKNCSSRIALDSSKEEASTVHLNNLSTPVVYFFWNGTRRSKKESTPSEVRINAETSVFFGFFS